tara:strand:- start:10635 stop:11333 length:699 start_codon:yes stop_codon:yes gene_type:complete
MINSVRNTVLAVANKQNFGYISPSDFNLYAKQAQLEIFEEYFYRYAQWLAKQNSRLSGSDYADIAQNLEETIDKFSKVSPLTFVSGDDFLFPPDGYYINTLRYNGKEADRVSNGKILSLLSSNLTTPTLAYPAYTLNQQDVTVYPTATGATRSIVAQYIRYPLDPKWTYISLAQGEPIFNQSAVDYQDFELPLSDEPEIISKILKYVGISLRETELYTASAADDVEEQQKKG